MTDHAITQLAPRLKEIAHQETPAVHLDGEPREVVMEALDSLVARNDPVEIFVRGGQLHRIVRDEHRRARLEPMSLPAIRVAVERAARLLKRTGDELRSVPAPRNLLESLAALGEWPDIPPIKAIVETPVLRIDGTLLDRPGYDPDTQLFYDPSPQLKLPSVPSKPSPNNVADAVNLLRREVLGDFPFAGAADEANAIALLITPIIRQLVPQVPLALLDAPRAGSGKGLLGAVVARIATGHPPAVIPAPQDDAEWRKTLTALLDVGSTFIFIDEVRTLRSPQLAAVLTASDYQARRLGKTEMILVPQRATWIAAGNNVQLGGDIPRRVYLIRLDPKMAQPWTRTDFRHASLEDWVTEQRGALLGALLELAVSWSANGKPAVPVPVVGGFNQWAETVGGILAHAGVEGFLTNLNDLYDANDEDSVAWESFLCELALAFGDDDFSTADLCSAIVSDERLRDALPPEIAEKRERPTFKIALGKALRGRRDTRHGDGGIRLTQASKDPRNRTPRWRIAVDQDQRGCGSSGSPPPRLSRTERPGVAEERASGTPATPGLRREAPCPRAPSRTEAQPERTPNGAA